MPVDYANDFAEEADVGVAVAPFRSLLDSAVAAAESRFGSSHQTWPLNRLRIHNAGPRLGWDLASGLRILDLPKWYADSSDPLNQGHWAMGTAHESVHLIAGSVRNTYLEEGLAHIFSVEFALQHQPAFWKTAVAGEYQRAADAVQAMLTYNAGAVTLLRSGGTRSLGEITKLEVLATCPGLPDSVADLLVAEFGLGTRISRKSILQRKLRSQNHLCIRSRRAK